MQFRDTSLWTQITKFSCATSKGDSSSQNVFTTGKLRMIRKPAVWKVWRHFWIFWHNIGVWYLCNLQLFSRFSCHLS